MINQERRTFYQNIQANKTGLLNVSEIHSIYWEESGKVDGLPAVILHGGPGGGSNPVWRGFFDPSVYRIVQLDQRGCGLSIPHCCIKENTTQDLIADIEKLRELLGIEIWHTVFGGSWGATLSLAYAQAHPQKVSHLVLRGIFLSRQWELDYLYKHGTGLIYPDEFNELKSLLPAEEQDDVLHNYNLRLNSDKVSQEEKEKLAIQWSKFESSAVKLIPNSIKKETNLSSAMASALIETHFLDNGCFFRNENQILEDIHIIQHIPTIIVHGRYDCICPVKSAWDLNRALPKSELVIVPDAGHSCMEPGIVHELVNATDKFKIPS